MPDELRMHNVQDPTAGRIWASVTAFEDESVLSIPPGHSIIGPDSRANDVTTAIATTSKPLDPIGRPLLIDVLHSTLAWNSSGEHHKRGQCNEAVDKDIRRRLG